MTRILKNVHQVNVRALAAISLSCAIALLALVCSSRVAADQGVGNTPIKIVSYTA